MAGTLGYVATGHLGERREGVLYDPGAALCATGGYGYTVGVGHSALGGRRRGGKGGSRKEYTRLRIKAGDKKTDFPVPGW